MNMNRLTALLFLVQAGFFAGCSNNNVRAGSAQPETPVGVALATRKPIMRQLTISAELIPEQETDVFAKESGYVKQLFVDYGSRVKKDQVMAILEIPELEAQLQQDAAAIRSMSDQVQHAQKQVTALEAQHEPYHQMAQRMKTIMDEKPGLLAQQEIDDAVGKDLSLEGQVEAAKANLQSVKSQLDAARAKEQRDRVLFDYSKVTAPFDGVVTQRYANLGALMQAGTSSATQAMPLVRVSEEDLFRLFIPVPESYVKYIKIGDSAEVRITSLDRLFPGTVTRISDQVSEETRTMHTEVAVHNPTGLLKPGMYAEATLTLERRNDALVVPLLALNQTGNQATILIVDHDDKIQQRTITLGLQTASDAEVVSGLNEGDRVIVSDRSGLKPGMQVKPQVVETPQMPADSSQ
jgi:RND family efflux transporter MFP subunit